MSYYGENDDYTKGWDDCDKDVVQPLEDENARLQTIIENLKANIRVYEEGTKPIRTEVGKTAL